VAGADQTVTDATTTYHLAWFLARHGLWHTGSENLRASETWAVAQNGQQIDPGHCTRLKSAAESLVSDATTIRYAKRYFDLVDGQMVWVPTTNWIEVDIAAPDCPYRQVRGETQSVESSGEPEARHVTR
jgi:hypothetical protein